MESPSQEDLDELLVFGYASKIYRDDERAQLIENADHLIPLLGDSSVLIDRYDGRGALVDLKACEPLRSGSPALSPEELQMERWCDLERYRDCQNEDEFENGDSCQDVNINGKGDDDELSNEKKKSRNYATLPYSYDSPAEDASSDDESTNFKKSKSRDHAYAPPPGLYVPPDLILPKTMKSHAVIEKTAKFIASHGTQMEIILKTKQGSNPLFNFLTLTDELNPYYKYLVTALKTHAYRPVPEHSTNETSPHESDSDGEEHYLHPSLVPKSSASSSENKASLLSEYKVSGPSAYSALVSKIQEMTPAVPEPEDTYSFLPYLDSSRNGTLEGQGHEQPLTGGRSQPSGESLVIIEKMANYVAKNGPAFETLASTKGDPRFKFLDPADPHHWYYIACKESYAGTQTAGGSIVASKFVSYTKEDPNVEKSESEPTTSVVESAEEPKQPIISRPSSMPPKPPPPNHANAINRMATLPPALIDKIEQLRRKTLESRAKVAEETSVTKYSAEPPKLESPVIQLPILSQPLPLTFTKHTAVLQNHNGQDKKPGTEDEETRRAERKKRAALFLQQMKKQLEENEVTTSTTNPPPPDSVAEADAESHEGNEVEIVAEVTHEEKESVAKVIPPVPSGESDDSEIEEIGRVICPLQPKRKRKATNSEEEEGELRGKLRKSKKRSKRRSSSSDESESDYECHHRSRSSSSRKKKSSKKKKHKKSEKSKRSSSSRKSKRRD